MSGNVTWEMRSHLVAKTRQKRGSQRHDKDWGKRQLNDWSPVQHPAAPGT